MTSFLPWFSLYTKVIERKWSFHDIFVGSETWQGGLKPEWHPLVFVSTTPLHSEYFCTFAIYRWLYIPHTSANPVRRTQRDQPNWTVTEFKEDCSRERLSDFWQSRRGQLHVFRSFRTAWCRKRNEDVSWRDTANCGPLSYGPAYAGKLNRSTNLALWKVFC